MFIGRSQGLFLAVTWNVQGSDKQPRLQVLNWFLDLKRSRPPTVCVTTVTFFVVLLCLPLSVSWPGSLPHLRCHHRCGLLFLCPCVYGFSCFLSFFKCITPLHTTFQSLFDDGCSYSNIPFLLVPLSFTHHFCVFWNGLMKISRAVKWSSAVM